MGNSSRSAPPDDVTTFLLLFLLLVPSSLACDSHHHCHPKHCPKPPKCREPGRPREPPLPPPPPVRTRPPPVAPPQRPPLFPPPGVRTAPATGTCPVDALKLGLCVDVLGGLVHIGIGSGAREQCCPLLSGLADLDAALCLCLGIKGKLLNLDLLLPIALSLLLDCGKYLPSDYKCPPLP